MSESKTYVFGENGSGTGGGGLNSILAMLPALMQRQGIDPSLFALCNGKNGNGFGTTSLRPRARSCAASSR